MSVVHDVAVVAAVVVVSVVAMAAIVVVVIDVVWCPDDFDRNALWCTGMCDIS